MAGHPFSTNKRLGQVCFAQITFVLRIYFVLSLFCMGIFFALVKITATIVNRFSLGC